LPSSLTRVLPRAFVFSTRPPVSVYGTGTPLLTRGFSRQCDSRDFGTFLPSPSQLMHTMHGFAYASHSLLGRPLPSGRFPEPPASPHRSNAREWYWNFHQLSFDYAFRPRLRSRLTLGGRSFPRNPWAFGGQDSHLSFRYLYRHSHFHALHHTFQYSFSAHGTLPYHAHYCASKASVSSLAPLHFPRSATRPVSYYALFEWWLLLSQHPGCLCNATSFPTELVLWDLSCWSGLFPF
jgi:hypothetical protein